MSEFARLQSDFQRGILTGDDSILAEILDSPKEKREVLYGVYRHAYGSRLVDALRNDQSVVPRLSARIRTVKITTRLTTAIEM